VSEALVIQSHRGPYSVRFSQGTLRQLADESFEKRHFIIDANVATIYREDLEPILRTASTLVIEATEPAKTLDRFTGYVETLVSQSVRRDHLIVAIGGGIIQDITAFLATTLLRGVPWEFYPTTLLAQADSCIGSKSSINVGSAKNILGTYCPPGRITIDPELLQTLAEVDVCSGIGEMLKVHAIAGPSHFDEIAAVYEQLLSDRNILRHFINRSLEIKKAIIEADEFDTGVRNVMNYGHSFGHAIEAASDFAVPHGIAVTIGMDLANHVAVQLGRVSRDYFNRMHSTLMTNSRGFHSVEIPQDRFFAALGKDKKNVGAQLSLILPDAAGVPQRTVIDNTQVFRGACVNYFFEVLKDG
jgi:3-dehydroquinate synthase